MQALLKDLNSLPGVVGSMFCDSRGVLSRAFPVDFDDDSLGAIVSALAASTTQLRSLTGAIGVIDLRFHGTRVLIRPAGEAFLVILCERSANAQELLAFAVVACKKLERLRSAAAIGPSSAPAAPAVEPATPAPGIPAVELPAPAPVPPAGALVPVRAAVPSTALMAEVARPRRRIPLVAPVVAAVVLALVIGGVALLKAGGGAPRQEPVSAVDPAPAVAPAPAAPAPEPPPAPPVQVRLRLSGADTLAAELMPALATAYLGARKATGVQVARAGLDDVLVSGVEDGTAVGVAIRSGSTAQGVEELAGGNADVALASRRLSAEERQRLSAPGAMTSPVGEHVLGVDGITVVVNKANPIPSLSREQLGSILGGAVGDWSRLRGKGGPAAGEVHVYLPDDRTGIPETVQALVLLGKPFATGTRRLTSPQAVSNAVSADPGGLGLVPMAAVAGARAVPIGDARKPPCMPTAFTVASEDYLLTRRLYLYTAQASANPQAAQFVDFALSAEGQALLRRAGFVEMVARPEPRAAPGTPADAQDAARRPPHQARADTGPAVGPTPADAREQPAPARGAPPGPAEASPGGSVASTAPAAPPQPQAPQTPRPAAPAVEDAPVYAKDGYRHPRTAEPGCVQREVRMPAEVLDRVGGKPITVKFAVSKDGKPGRFQVMTPGFPAGGGTAIWSAIQACKWIPGADEAGEPAELWVIVPFRFARD